MHKNKKLIIGNNLKLTIVFGSAGHLGRLLHHLPGLLVLEVPGDGGDQVQQVEAHQGGPTALISLLLPIASALSGSSSYQAAVGQGLLLLALDLLDEFVASQA